MDDGGHLIFSCSLSSTSLAGLSSANNIDNMSAIQVAKNPEHHGRMKQLDLSFFWLRKAVNDGLISPSHLSTVEMPADLLTKPLSPDLVVKHRIAMGLV